MLAFLLTAATNGEEQICKWIEAGEVKPDAAFAQVFLDPTNPRDQVTIDQRIFAIVIFGDPAKAFGCLPNATAKADAADRHGWSNGELVDDASFCLGNGDYAWGCSASYKGAISAGSGLTVEQDKELAQLGLESVMNAVHHARARWLDQSRRVGKAGLVQSGQHPWSAVQRRHVPD